MTEYTKCNLRHLLHHFLLAKLLHFPPTLSHCFLIFPLNSVLKTVTIVFLWKGDWILSFFCLEASCNFLFQSKCQTPYNQQSVACILVSCYLSNLFYTLLCSHPVPALSYSDAVISILYLCYSVFPLSENSLPPVLIATLGPSDLCLNGVFWGKISMADYSLEIFTPSSHPIPVKDVYLPIPPPWFLAFAMQIADGILHRLFLLKNHQAGPLAPGGK